MFCGDSPCDLDKIDGILKVLINELDGENVSGLIGMRDSLPELYNGESIKLIEKIFNLLTNMKGGKRRKRGGKRSGKRRIRSRRKSLRGGQGWSTTRVDEPFPGFNITFLCAVIIYWMVTGRYLTADLFPRRGEPRAHRRREDRNR